MTMRRLRRESSQAKPTTSTARPAKYQWSSEAASPKRLSRLGSVLDRPRPQSDSPPQRMTSETRAPKSERTREGFGVEVPEESRPATTSRCSSVSSADNSVGLRRVLPHLDGADHDALRETLRGPGGTARRDGEVGEEVHA